MSDLPKRLRIKAGMIALGERIAWGSDTALMEEAADVIEALSASVENHQLHMLGMARDRDQLRALLTAQPQASAAQSVPAGAGRDGLPLVIAGAIFDFAGFLTTREGVIEVGATANASPVADLIQEWAELRGLSLADAAVLSWQDLLAAAPAQPAAQDHSEQNLEMVRQDQSDAVRTLIKYATGKIRHSNLGMCPDEVEGSKTRDPDCSVCQAIVTVESRQDQGEVQKLRGLLREFRSFTYTPHDLRKRIDAALAASTGQEVEK